MIAKALKRHGTPKKRINGSEREKPILTLTPFKTNINLKTELCIFLIFSCVLFKTITKQGKCKTESNA